MEQSCFIGSEQDDDFIQNLKLVSASGLPVLCESQLAMDTLWGRKLGSTSLHQMNLYILLVALDMEAGHFESKYSSALMFKITQTTLRWFTLAEVLLMAAINQTEANRKVYSIRKGGL